MKSTNRPAKQIRKFLFGFFVSVLMLLIASSGSTPARGQGPQIPIIPPGSAYRQTNFVSDIPGFGYVLDPFLVNPWGISMTASSPFWVANNGRSVTQLIRGDMGGAPVVLNPSPQTVTIPGGLPTGTVANPVNTEFVLPGPCATSSAPCGANFLFASITGNISGWDPNAPAAGSTTAVIAASQPGHVYTGLAYANNGTANFIYAADFANGTIDVFNSSFVLQPAASFPFTDPTIPATAGNTFYPYNIQNIGGSLYVAYAKIDPFTGRAEDGVGNGFVRRFNTNGIRDLTFSINNGPLNSPWGIVIAPASWGIFGGALLVGNFGEGNPSIHGFNPTTGAFLGTIQNENGDGIVIDELWALTFGNGGAGGDANTIYFTAGTAEEEHGLFGSLKPTTASATSLIQFATDEFTISEGTGHIDVSITRAGDVSSSATINFNTFDESQPANASQKSDYEISLSTVTFDPGETSKTVRILIVNDSFAEGNETISLALSNPTGAGVGLGTPNIAFVSITDNDAVAPATNPVDDSSFFVRQNYLDFLNREPDSAGFAFWVNQIESCGGDAQCREVKRINVSAAFFLSIEFQQSGLAAYLTHRAAFGPIAIDTPAPVLYGNFMHDLAAINRGVVFGQPGADTLLESNKVAFYNEFVTRPEFVSKYPSTQTNGQYVDALLASANLTPSEVRLFNVSLTNSQEVPPTNPTTSSGGARPASFGTAKLQFNSAQTAMTFNATINNIDLGGSQTADTNDNLTNAHIHAGPSVMPGVNGPVVWGFYGSPFNDNNPNDQVFAPLGSGVGGTFKGKWDAPEGNGTTLAAQLANIRAGRAYVNFHTVQFGGGEIRGNVAAENAFRDSLVAGLGSTETRATVLRKVSEQEELKTREFNSAFVAMEYFGYLRRNPDTAGFNFWLNKLNSFNGDFVASEMVKAFISSGEYRQRFGP